MSRVGCATIESLTKNYLFVAALAGMTKLRPDNHLDPLLSACMSGSLATVKRLIRDGADLDKVRMCSTVPGRGTSSARKPTLIYSNALGIAACRDHVEVVRCVYISTETEFDV